MVWELPSSPHDNVRLSPDRNSNGLEIFTLPFSARLEVEGCNHTSQIKKKSPRNRVLFIILRHKKIDFEADLSVMSEP